MLDYLTGKPIDIARRAHVVVSAVRNEMLRLPYWFSYYRGIGIDRFILVDNGSDDGTREFLLGQPGVFLFGTRESFGGSEFGMRWVNPLLDRFCGDRWILLADADELLVWPGSEGQGIGELTGRLESLGAEGLFAVLLDMYSDKAFGEIGYKRGEAFLDRCPFFDRGAYQFVRGNVFPNWQIYGGVRERVFREMKGTAVHPPTVSKVPLVRWRAGQRFIHVAHLLGKAVNLAPMRGALLHFKMLDDLVEKCAVEAARGEHFEGGGEYRALGMAIEQSPNWCFFDSRVSVRYGGTGQLVSLGIMSERGAFDR